MFCKNCGKELPDSAKFCNNCGTPVAPPAAEPEAPAAPVEEPVQAPVEETPVPPAAPEIPEAPAAAPEPSEEPAAPAAAPKAPVTPPPFQPASPAVEIPAEEEIPAPVKKRRGASGMVVIGVGAVAAVVVVVLLFKLFSGMIGGGGGKRGQAFAYLNDDYELMYLSDLKEKTEAIEVSDEADSSARVQFTTDGKTMYFRDNRNALYKIAVSELKKDGRPERISRDVTSFTVLKTGNVLYTKSGSRGTELNCYTGKDDFRITKGYDSRELSEDHKTVYYTELDEDDGTYTLYKMALKSDAESEELLDGATAIYTDFDSDVLVYGEDDADNDAAYAEDVDRNTLTVYSCKPGGEPTELLDDVYSVYGVTADGGKVSFYYSTEEVEKYTFYDLVSDSKAGEDEATLAKELTSPNWYNEYSPSGAQFEGGAWYYTTNSGEKFPVDSAALIASYGSAGNDLNEYQVRNAAGAAAQTRYNEALEVYKGERELYNQAQTRSRIREGLKNNETSQSSLSLYHYTGSSDGDPIATGINQGQWSYAAKDGIFLYKKSAGISGGKLCDVADMTSYNDIYNYMGTSSSDDDWYQNVGGTESVLDLDSAETYISGIHVLNGKEAVLELSEDGDRWLDAYSIDKTALTFANTVIDDDFAGLRRSEDAKGNDVLYFFTDTESENYGTVGDFTRYSGGKSEVLAKEVYAVQILKDSDVMYAYTDRDRSGYELSLLQGDKPTAINDEVDGGVLIFLDAKQALYTSDGDLFLWNGKEERRVAKDVEYVWANDKMSYYSYSIN